MTRYRSDCGELWDSTAWQAASVARQGQVITAVLSSLEREFEHTRTVSYDKEHPIPIATVRDRQTGILFNIIPGGRFTMGMSERELHTFEQSVESSGAGDCGVNPKTMMPAHEVQVPPFLCARFPLLEREAQVLIEIDDEDGRPEFGDPEDSDLVIPIHLTLREAKRVVEKTGFRLLSEAEREYTCRGNSTSLFYFGDKLPRNLGKTVCLIDYKNEKQNDRASNRFGLVGLAVGDFCEDVWHDNYVGAPTDGSAWTGKGSVRVVRGGAAALWPWRDGCEWMLLVSAMRVRSDQVWEKMSGVRLGLSIPA